MTMQVVTMNAKILMVDDEASNIKLLTQVLQRGGFHQLVTTTESTDAERLFKAESPDIVLLDLQMPHLDGFGVMTALKPHIGPESFVPIMVLTADTTKETRERALRLGAN